MRLATWLLAPLALAVALTGCAQPGQVAQTPPNGTAANTQYNEADRGFLVSSFGPAINSLNGAILQFHNWEEPIDPNNPSLWLAKYDSLLLSAETQHANAISVANTVTFPATAASGIPSQQSVDNYLNAARNYLTTARQIERVVTKCVSTPGVCSDDELASVFLPVIDSAADLYESQLELDREVNP